ncbi:tetratricopeptide repeat protein [Seonamhaeicola marinus]|uniref:Tetratricopeptide repeat protein n=1 Tax=Seonamhaeicola marinus TaxID=1912246 RepID=A0A5D0JCA8_9FLAO|nr:hypothetical protein [Seonamhaeicola marinus]TYA92207.1 hypothetical protein FUA24_01895 [Seonamhaeicola marinus]
MDIVKLSNTIENDSLVLELGDNIQNMIINGDVDGYLNYFDIETFSHFITEGVSQRYNSDKFQKDYITGIKAGLKSLPQKIIDEVNAGGYYDFVNYFYDETTQSYNMLFRLYSSLTGVNYHQYRVSKKDDTFLFNDIYVYLSGEDLSATFKRFYMYSLPKKSLFSLFGENNSVEFLKVADAVKLYNQGEFQKAYQKFNEIKGDLKNDKFTLILKSTCAAEINDRAYKNSMELIAKTYPNDPTLYLNQIDYYIITKEYDKALELLNRLEDETSDDFLIFLKGNIEIERPNPKKAVEHYKYISDNYPEFSEGHTSYLYALCLNGEYDKCIDLLDVLVESDYLKEDLVDFIEEVDENGINELEDFVKSKQYKTWKKA